MEQRHSENHEFHLPDLSNASLPKNFRQKEETNQFESRSEFACVSLLKRYLPDWSPIRGDTYQVPIGLSKVADFRVGNTIVEFHPIVLKWSFEDKVAWKKLIQSFNGMSRKAKEDLKSALCKEFETRYYKQRLFIMRNSDLPAVRKMNLLCVHSDIDFITRVIIPYSGRSNLNNDSLRAEFKRAIKSRK